MDPPSAYSESPTEHALDEAPSRRGRRQQIDEKPVTAPQDFDSGDYWASTTSPPLSLPPEIDLAPPPPRRSRFVTPRKQNKSGAKGSTLIQKLVLSLFILIFLINFDRKFKFLKRRYRGSGRLCDHANFTPRAGDISKGVELEASVTLDI